MDSRSSSEVTAAERVVRLRHRFKPYPAYKDSGVEWLGEIPAQWEVKRLKFVADLNPSAFEIRGLHHDFTGKRSGDFSRHARFFLFNLK